MPVNRARTTRSRIRQGPADAAPAARMVRLPSLGGFLTLAQQVRSWADWALEFARQAFDTAVAFRTAAEARSRK